MLRLSQMGGLGSHIRDFSTMERDLQQIHYHAAVSVCVCVRGQSFTTGLIL